MSRAAVLAAALVAAALVGAARSPAQQPTQPAAAPPPSAPAPAAAAPATPHAQHVEDEFINLKVLQGVQPPQLFDTMMVMRASLGVRCDYCHVLVDQRYDLDTKPPKQAARDMIQMVRKINQDFYAGETVVTCQTCHQGQIHPPRAPAVELGLLHEMVPGNPLGGPAQQAISDLPGAAEVLDRYLEALGGRAALEGVQSRRSRGTLLRSGLTGLGTIQAHTVNRGVTDPLEIVQRLPDQVTITQGPPAAQMVQSYDGTSGSIVSPKGRQGLNSADAARLAARFDLRKDLKLRDQAATARVLGREKIDGRETYVLETPGPDGNPVHFNFDVQTGLLRRQTTYRPTLIGPYPERTDYEDYRAVGRVKVPFNINFSPLNDLNYGFTRQFTEVSDNFE